MSIELNREALIREGDEEVVIREQEERRRKKRASDTKSIVEEAIEAWMDKQAREPRDRVETEDKETKQESSQIEVSSDPNDKEPFHLKSKVNIGKSGSPSLRATVPEGIVVFLDLKAGDKLEWKMDIVNGKRVATVKKVKP